MEWITRKIGFDYYEVVKANSLARGIAMMWRNEINLKHMGQSERTINFEVLNAEGETIWDLVVSHSTLYLRDKMEFWKQMQT